MNREQTGCISFFFVLFSLVLFFLPPVFRCLIPAFIGSALISIVDNECKKAWGLPNHKWSRPVSWRWTFLTALTMFISFFLTIFIQMGEIPFYILIITVCIYTLLSILILSSKYKKIHLSTNSTPSVFSQTSTRMDISSIDGMEGHQFEQFCAGLLEQNGFVNVEVTRGSGDQGVDIVASKDGIKYAIQCKNYASKLGNKPIQEVYTGKTLYQCDIGVVMTNSTFTQAAIDAAKATNTRLWGREQLQLFMQNANGIF